MARLHANDVGFCVVDSNADLIAGCQIDRLLESLSEGGSTANRLYRGRNVYGLSGLRLAQLRKAREDALYLARTIDDVLRAQSALEEAA